MAQETTLERIGRWRRMVVAGDIELLRYALWLRLKGLDFSGASPASLGLPTGRAHEHSHSGGPHLAKVLTALGFPPGKGSAGVIDFGSGKGLAAITLSQHFASVVGVELSEHLVEVARINVKRLGLLNIRFECVDAGRFYDDSGRFQHVYMFNPFPSAVMVEVAANLVRSLAAHPRSMTIIYKNPICHDVLVAAGFIKSQEFSFRQSHPFFIYTR